MCAFVDRVIACRVGDMHIGVEMLNFQRMMLNLDDAFRVACPVQTRRYTLLFGSQFRGLGIELCDCCAACALVSPIVLVDY